MSGTNFFKPKNIWVYFLVGFIVIAAALVFLYYYFNVYLTKPNFDNPSLNFVSSSAGQTVKPDDVIEYTVNYKNNGNRLVEDFNIEVVLSEHVTFIGSTYDDILKIDLNKAVFNFGVVKKHQEGKLLIKVKVNKPLDNKTEIKLSDVKFKYKIKQEDYQIKIGPEIINIVESSPNLENFSFEVVDVNGGEFRLKDILQYNIMIENTGDMNAKNIEIVSEVSEYLDVIDSSISKNGKIISLDGLNSLSDTQKDNINNISNDRAELSNLEKAIVLFNIDNLPINEPLVLNFKAKVKDGINQDKIVTNKGTLKYGDFIIEKSDEKKLVLYPDLSTSDNFLADENGGRLWAGEVISVKIVIKNTGEKLQENYKLICPIPKGATYISQSGTPEGIRWSDEIRGLIWDLKNLDVGKEKVITFRMSVDESLADTGGTITSNFVIEIDTQKIDLPKKSIKVSGKVKLTIVAMGDSLIAKSNWVQIFDELLEQRYPHADYNTIPSAKSGELSGQGLARFDSTVAPLKPDIIIIAYGSNDAGFSVSGFRSNMESLIVKSQMLGARVFVNLIGPDFYPGKESWPMYNQVIREVAAKHGAVVIDVVTPLSQNVGANIMSDGIHYTQAGASVVAHTVFNYVTQYLGDVGQKL